MWPLLTKWSRARAISSSSVCCCSFFFFLLVKEICFSSFNILFKFILSTLELKLCSSNTFCQKTFVHKSQAGCGLNEAENTHHRSLFYCNPQFCKMRENTIELSSRRSNIPHLPKCIFISTISNLEDFFSVNKNQKYQVTHWY